MAENAGHDSGSDGGTPDGGRTQVQRLAAYAHRAQFGDLSPESVRQLPVHVLDCLGCCLAAPGAPPVDACRAQVQDFAGTGPCSLIAGGTSNPVYAAFWHTALVRYVDFMDNFPAPTETCHTADNFGSVLTAAEYAGASGRDLMLGVALAYTVQSRFTDHANFMTRGFDVTANLAFSLPAAGRPARCARRTSGPARPRAPPAPPRTGPRGSPAGSRSGMMFPPARPARCPRPGSWPSLRTRRTPRPPGRRDPLHHQQIAHAGQIGVGQAGHAQRVEQPVAAGVAQQRPARDDDDRQVGDGHIQLPEHRLGFG